MSEELMPDLGQFVGWVWNLKAERDQLRAELAALKAQQAEQKPYAWALALPDGRVVLEKAYPHWIGGDTGGDRYSVTPLYTAPQPAPAQDVAGLVAEMRKQLEFSEHVLDCISRNREYAPLTTQLVRETISGSRNALAAHEKQSGGEV